ncbi:MAG: FAD-dependent oxidoreductase [Clostridia bacterium]
MIHYDVVVVGGGPAGLASALSAKEQNAKVLIIERDARLGGILNQCIHNGFGLHYFKQELTGPEYAQRFVNLVNDANIDTMLSTFVIDMRLDGQQKSLTVVSASKGILEITCNAVVLAMGCRERSAGAINIAGDRPSGVFTAGLAQRLCNIEGYLVGKKIVILGSGDIGLIMARRMTFEGAKVLMVCEVMPYSSGLKRNIVQCLNDFDIPLYFSTTVTRIIGKSRVEAVEIAEVDDKMRVIESTKRIVECDTLLLSVGLIPENDLVASSNMQFDRITSGAIVDDNRQTSISGVFACGNTLHVHDLVDNVSAEGLLAGKSAGLYALNKLPITQKFAVSVANGVRYALPQQICQGEGKVKLFLRVDKTYKSTKLVIYCGEQKILSRAYLVMSPGEMVSVELDKSAITNDLIVKLEV